MSLYYIPKSNNKRNFLFCFSNFKKEIKKQGFLHTLSLLTILHWSPMVVLAGNAAEKASGILAMLEFIVKLVGLSFGPSLLTFAVVFLSTRTPRADSVQTVVSNSPYVLDLISPSQGISAIMQRYFLLPLPLLKGTQFSNIFNL